MGGIGFFSAAVACVATAYNPHTRSHCTRPGRRGHLKAAYARDFHPLDKGARILATYIVFTRESTQDQQELDIYASKVGATLAGHPVKVLAAYGAQETLEGEGPEGVVIVEFPSKEAAHAWYHGPEYQAVVQHRFKGARYRAVLVEGV